MILKATKHEQDAGLHRRRTISPGEYARQSGLSEATVRRAVGRGEITAFRIGRRLLIPADELDRRLAKISETEMKEGNT